MTGLTTRCGESVCHRYPTFQLWRKSYILIDIRVPHLSPSTIPTAQVSDNSNSKSPSKHQDSDHSYNMPSDGSQTIALAVEDHAFVDGSTTSVPVSVTQSGNILQFSLPYFASSVWYDPSITAGSTSGAAAKGVGVLAAMAMSMIAAVMGLRAE